MEGRLYRFHFVIPSYGSCYASGGTYVYYYNSMGLLVSIYVDNVYGRVWRKGTIYVGRIDFPIQLTGLEFAKKRMFTSRIRALKQYLVEDMCNQ